MVIRYPNGKAFTQQPTPVKSTAKKRKKETYSNRGKSLEDDLNDTNQYYLVHEIATIHKKPVPIQIVKVEYPSRSAAVIREAYFRTPSTTDYNGVWNGYYIDFEAKETENKTSFPLRNIHAHQIAHMKSIIKQRGITFFIIRFSTLERDFVAPFELINSYWDEMEQGGRKSIPLSIFEKCAYEIESSYLPRINYLPIIEEKFCTSLNG